MSGRGRSKSPRGRSTAEGRVTSARANSHSGNNRNEKKPSVIGEQRGSRSRRTSKGSEDFRTGQRERRERASGNTHFPPRSAANSSRRGQCGAGLFGAAMGVANGGLVRDCRRCQRFYLHRFCRSRVPSSLLLLLLLVPFLSLLQLLLFGSTLGKLALGLLVLDSKGRASLVVRELLLDIFTAVPLINILSIAVGMCCHGESCDFFHDRVCGNKVVLSRPTSIHTADM